MFLEPHGDHQIGSLLVDYDKLQERIDALKEKNRYTILMGDMCDNISAYAGGAVDKRFDPTQIDPMLNTFERQSKHVVKLYEPLPERDPVVINVPVFVSCRYKFIVPPAEFDIEPVTDPVML